MYGYGSLKQRITCLFNRFRPYNKISSKGCVGGLNKVLGFNFLLTLICNKKLGLTEMPRPVLSLLYGVADKSFKVVGQFTTLAVRGAICDRGSVKEEWQRSGQRGEPHQAQNV